MKKISSRILIESILLLGLLACNNEQKPVAYTAKRIAVNAANAGLDTEVEKEIANYKSKVDKETGRVIGYSDYLLAKGKPESLLTNYVSDLLLQRGVRMAKELGKPIPQMAFTNNGGFRTAIHQGAITVGDIYKVMPFENKLVIIGLNGLQMKAFLDLIASEGGEGVSGLKMVIKNGTATQVRIADGPLKQEASKMYYVLTTDYLANGGGGDILKEAKFRYYAPLLMRDAIIEHIEAAHERGEKVRSSLDKRIVDLDTQKKGS